jgi:low temperature requirement protein LtrA
VSAAAETEHRVTPLELFFDLVFVFAITQVTTLLARDTTWTGVLHGVLVLAAVWWTWTGYAWLTNNFDADAGGIRLAVLAAMAALLVVSLAVPGAFGEHAVLFGAAYFVVRALHLVLHARAAKDEPELVGATLRFAPFALFGAGVILLAGFLHGDARLIAWILALVIDYAGAVFGARSTGWRLSPEHFVERHGLIIIIALGESIIAVGVATDLALSVGVVTAAVLAIVVVAALWWLYFDVFTILARGLLDRVTGVHQVRLARDCYSYLHLPMVAGIVLFALGLKKTLVDVGDPLATVPAVCLCGGVGLYLLAHIAFMLRLSGRLFRRRTIGAVVSFSLIPAATELPALASLALVGGVCVFVVAYEVIAHREHRAEVRASSWAETFARQVDVRE